MEYLFIAYSAFIFLYVSWNGVLDFPPLKGGSCDDPTWHTRNLSLQLIKTICHVAFGSEGKRKLLPFNICLFVYKNQFGK